MQIFSLPRMTTRLPFLHVLRWPKKTGMLSTGNVERWDVWEKETERPKTKYDTQKCGRAVSVAIFFVQSSCTHTGCFTPSGSFLLLKILLVFFSFLCLLYSLLSNSSLTSGLPHLSLPTLIFLQHPSETLNMTMTSRNRGDTFTVSQ